MARILIEEEYNAKRNAILAAAQELVYSKGYEKMTIQDILNALGISKGTFFHYFSSKQVLLETLVERFMDEGEKQIVPIVRDENLTALQKLNRYFEVASQWKAGRKAYLLRLMRVWYSDHNAIVRQKMLTTSKKRILPLLNPIILQGIREGVFKPSYPEQAGEMVLSLIQNLWDRLCLLILSDENAEKGEVCFQEIKNILSAYTDTVAKVLGVRENTLELIDDEMMKMWLDPNQGDEQNVRIKKHR